MVNARLPLISPPTLTETSARIRYDLPGAPLTLGDARLAVANATLAMALKGQLLLARPLQTPSTIVQENARLLSWLGIDAQQVGFDQAQLNAALECLYEAVGDGASRDGDLLRVAQDQVLGVTHVIIGSDDACLAAMSQRAARALGGRAVRYGSLGPTRLSDDKAPPALAWYRQRGYLPEGLRTYLVASTCWATPPAEPDDDEVVRRHRRGELVKGAWCPTLDQIDDAGRRAMRRACPERVVPLLRSRLQQRYGCWHRSSGTAHQPEAWLRILTDALSQEAACLDEAVGLARFAFSDRVDTMTAEAWEALRDRQAWAVFEACLSGLHADALATPDAAQRFFQDLRHHFRDTVGLRGRRVMLPLRAALTGIMAGPCLGIVASLLGYERCVVRLHRALESLSPGLGDPY